MGIFNRQHAAPSWQKVRTLWWTPVKQFRQVRFRCLPIMIHNNIFAFAFFVVIIIPIKKSNEIRALLNCPNSLMSDIIGRLSCRCWTPRDSWLKAITQAGHVFLTLGTYFKQCWDKKRFSPTDGQLQYPEPALNFYMQERFKIKNMYL